MEQQAAVKDFEVMTSIFYNLEKCILGKRNEIKLMLTALLAGGHILLEDVPGTGKTVLIKALGKSIRGSFRRIQCNPDLLPTDITGVAIYHPKSESFVFRPGPVMTNILLIDEINRATTKTQSALLEAMEERHVTVDGEIHELPHPFLLMATQNPVDFEGTYTLPEAQLDRFMLKFSIGYPDRETEKQIVHAQRTIHPIELLEAVTDTKAILTVQQQVKEVHIDEALLDYIVSITRATRDHTAVYLGASPRATVALVNAAKAFAFLNGRTYVIPDDVKFLTPYVLAHRLILHSEARMEGLNPESVLEAILKQLKVPVRLEK
jgi:MoxR-like ATPase